MMIENRLVIQTQDERKEDMDQATMKFEHEEEHEDVIRFLGYEMGQEIGKSLFGKVYLCVDRKTGARAAIKTSKRSRLVTKWESPEEEWRLMRLATKKYRKEGADPATNHVLSLYNSVKTRHWMYTVTEYCPQGDLFDLISKVVYLSEDVARDYFHQALMALRQIHAYGIYHLDVSLENLFLTDENKIVLADFGCARKWVKGKRANFGNYRPGKWQYMSPEVYDWKPVYGELADVWSIGVCLFIMVTGKAPFRFPSKDDVNFVRIYNDKDFSRCDISDDCKDLLANILCPPDQRMKISDILRHPWMMFQSSSLLRLPSSRPSSPYRRRSLTHVSPSTTPSSPSVSPGSASPLSLSPRDHLKSFVIPSPRSTLFTRFVEQKSGGSSGGSTGTSTPNSEHKFLNNNTSHLLLKGTENKILPSPQLNRRTFSMSTLKELRNSLAQLCLQQQQQHLQQQNPLLR